MAPADFASNIVQDKTYEFATPAAESAGLELALDQILEASALGPGNDAWYRPGPTRGDPMLVRPRLGQQSFKAVVLNAYGRRCAVTGDRIRPVLEAAHIRPIADGGEHRIDNGMLMRSDVHTLFDRGYLGVDQRHQLHVSPRLRSEFGNGEHFLRPARKRSGTAGAVGVQTESRVSGVAYGFGVPVQLTQVPKSARSLMT